MTQIAKEHGMTFHNVRTIKEKGLRKLKYGRAKREILEKLEIAKARKYLKSNRLFLQEI